MPLHIYCMHTTIFTVFVAKTPYDRKVQKFPFQNGRAKTERHRLWDLSTQMPLKNWFKEFTTTGEHHRKLKEFRLILFKIYRNIL